MGLLARIRAALSPSKVTSAGPIAGSRPLWDQFQRIGGGLTPLDVSEIIRQADMGQTARLVDLANESRNKDGHLQSVLSTREGAVALCDLSFVSPPEPSRKERKALDLCKRLYEDFADWPMLIEHLTSSFFPGHATATLEPWKKHSDGSILPHRVEKAIRPREFLFSQSSGALRYARQPGDITGVDLLEENPGRVIQLQRRIIGDAPAREGLIRVLTWGALLRNWGLRDWIALGEIGWKPWRIGKYARGTHEDDVVRLVQLLERIGTTGVGAVQEGTEIDVQWPRGTPSGATTPHQALFELLGREMSKAVLGQTTTVEAGPNGDRAATQTRDQVRLDIRERDAIAVAAALRAHLFAPAVALNIGADVRVPTPWFQTDEATDMVAFSTAVEKLSSAGVRVPAKWVRDELGAPAPEDGEETIGESPKTPEPPATPGKRAKRILLSKAPVSEAPGFVESQLYVDALAERGTAAGKAALEPTLDAILEELDAATSYDDARARLRKRYAGLSPERMSGLLSRLLILGEMAGAAGVRQDGD